VCDCFIILFYFLFIVPINNQSHCVCRFHSKILTQDKNNVFCAYPQSACLNQFTDTWIKTIYTCFCVCCVCTYVQFCILCLHRHWKVWSKNTLFPTPSSSTHECSLLIMKRPKVHCRCCRLMFTYTVQYSLYLCGNKKKLLGKGVLFLYIIMIMRVCVCSWVCVWMCVCGFMSIRW
jgi:hypothetical protein